MLLISFIVIACVNNNNENDNKDDLNGDNGDIIVEGIEIQDSFTTIQFENSNITESSIESIRVEDILLHTVLVTDIEFIDLSFTSINDEFVYLAYKHFVEFYDADIDWDQFIKDFVIGAGVVIIMVTLSTVGGPIGTFFGGVIASEFTAGAVVLGAAIDAAVSGYMAYQEGGDLTYVLGHMLQGVADGFKFGAFMAPISGLASGINALKAVNKLQKIPGFENLTQKQATEILKNASKILSSTKNLTKEATNNALKEVYQASAKNLSSEITEEMFIKVFRNQTSLISIIKNTNAFNTTNELLKNLKVNFMSKSGVASDQINSILKKIQNHTIKKFDDITDVTVKKFIEQNVGDFVELFGKSVSKDFLDDLIVSKLGDDVANIIASNITVSKNAYIEIIEKIGKDTLDKIIVNTDMLFLLQARYGAKNIINIMNIRNLYNCLIQDNQISHNLIKKVIDELYAGTIKSIDDISKISGQIAKNIQYSREIFVKVLNDLGLNKKMNYLINELIVEKVMKDINVNIITKDILSDILFNSLSKSDIFKKYGQDVYNELVDKSFSVICSFGIQNNTNKTLLKELLTDMLLVKDFTNEMISNIIKGAPLNSLNISDDLLKQTWQVISSYYRLCEPNVYKNFVIEISEIRGEWISEFISNYELAGNTIRNKANFAGHIMDPTGENAKRIKEMYGDILMSECGFVNFDQFSVALYISDSLTGINGGKNDIIQANLAVFGIKSTPKGYTWHHLEDGKTMILIPTDLHEAYRHTGGADLLREGLKDIK